ncbi:hypothetical protein ACFOWZ_17855 [Lentzea rhizosphaerae]|uniref:Uncharacterized protein n=1 Tax=Lentzea rhizosphaerae TaxID=2041025 RepID=A0ABV8BSX9_9PSEU
MTAQGDWTLYQWRKVSSLHAEDAADGDKKGRCTGTIRSYAYRYYPPASTFYERCIGLAWCSDCRAWSSAMVHVPRDRVMDDPLAGLAPEERDRLHRKERELVRHLDRMVRRGLL